MMSNPYERAKAGRLMFKGGTLATVKSIDKKKNKKKKNIPKDHDPSLDEVQLADESASQIEGGEASADIYTIDAARKMKYDDLFPVEAKKFGYDPMAKVTSVEQALDDRVKKKADRYCK